MRRRIFLFGLLAGVVAMGIGGWLLRSQPRSVITRENAAKLHVGMTLAEVETIRDGQLGDGLFFNHVSP
jgi:hypothetical protein